MVSNTVVGSFTFNTEVKGKRGKTRGREDNFGSTLYFIAVKVYTSLFLFHPSRLFTCQNFFFIQGLPKLEGCINKMPETAYAGDLRLVMLELKNQSEYPVKVCLPCHFLTP